MSRYTNKARPSIERREYNSLNIKENDPPQCPHCMSGEIYYYPLQGELMCNKCRGVVQLKTRDGKKVIINLKKDQ